MAQKLTKRYRTARSFTVLTLAIAFVMVLLPALGVSTSRAQAGPDQKVVVLTSKGPITPVLAGYIERGLQEAEQQQAQAVILQLDTPGGSVDLMLQIVQIIRSSPVPFVVYVSPRSAMAGSAGTIITLAGHVAAMASQTTIGAASPVGAQGEDIGTTMESKVKEMLKAEVRTLTRSRGSEATSLAEDTIENARAVTEEEALKAGLVDIVAPSLDDLLNQLDGRSIAMDGEKVILQTRGAEIRPLKNTLIEELLLLLVNPNLVFLLLAIGVQAILIELSSPGGWVSGFIGVVCLLLAIYGLGVLPVNWFGILFLILAFILFILELKTPTVGMLTAAGALSFIVGALVLFNSVRMPGFPKVSVPLVISTAIFLAFSFLAIVTFALRAQRQPVRMGSESIPGKTGVVRTDLSPVGGTVQVAGELWGAELAADEPDLPAGTRIEVVRVEGLRLIVRRARK